MEQEKLKNCRESLRGLIVVYVVLFVLFLVFNAFESISVAVAEGLSIQRELSPLSGFWTFVQVVVYLALLVLLIWGLIEMWQFDSRGIVKLVVAVVFPVFFFDNEVFVHGAITEYLVTLEGCVFGAIVASYFFAPEIFEHSNDVDESEDSAGEDEATDV